MNTEIQQHKDRAEIVAAKAREVAERAVKSNRAMTSAEQRTYDASMGELSDLVERVKLARGRDSWASVESIEALHNPNGTAGTGIKSGQRLSFKGNMATEIANRMLSGHQGEKTLAPSGATVVPQAFIGDPVALGRVATGLLDVLPTRAQTSAQYAYLRQTTRENLAAVVEDGDVKPTSLIGLTRIDASLSVIATLSESVNKFWLIDNGALEVFISTELTHHLAVATEQKIVDDINDTSGLQTQAFSNSALETIRRSIAKLEIAGEQPSAVLMHPTDFMECELALASTNAVEHLSLPYEPALRRLYGLPVVTTVSATVGTGHVIAEGAVVVSTDSSTGVSVQWSENVGDSFSRNELVLRAELRTGTDVLRPLGIVVADLAA